LLSQNRKNRRELVAFALWKREKQKNQREREREKEEREKEEREKEAEVFSDSKQN